MTVSSRFWAKVDSNGTEPAHVPGIGSCWEWTAALTVRGYGWFNAHGSPILAHRYIWESNRGAIPRGMQILHRCDNKPCVRMDHLFMGTPADNMTDKVAKGRGKTNGFEKRTHCPQGHAYDERNTYVYRNRRHCRECSRLKMARRAAAKRADHTGPQGQSCSSYLSQARIEAK